ncbi:DsbA family protein [Rhizobium laguerreae]|uniref:DsbA family protein n=1 Tax=Rhizobium laguerreae TaxID=1076926 RepID=UPI0028AD44D8|nr:DsbA family protein [Rhizobium laguerreae]
MIESRDQIIRYFDYRSPYSFLALSQVQKMDVEIAFHPLEIGDLMKQVVNVPTSITCAPKGRYVMTDLQRWAVHYGVSLNWHPQLLEIDASRLLRATLAAAGTNRYPNGPIPVGGWTSTRFGTSDLNLLPDAPVQALNVHTKDVQVGKPRI